jgi:DNA replication protein DnaC
MPTLFEEVATATCELCGDNFTPKVLTFGKTFFPQRNCDSCNESPCTNDDSRTKDARRIAFRNSIPALFRETDRKRIPAVLLNAIDSYTFGSTGLGFSGASGEGKTRSMFLLLERLAVEGNRVDYITSTDLSHCAIEQFSDDSRERDLAKEKLRSMMRSDIVLIDDLAKSRMTDRVQATLFDILDHRTNHGLPIIWTSNASSRDLHSIFTSDRADAMLRRLVEFCHVVRL